MLSMSKVPPPPLRNNGRLLEITKTPRRANSTWTLKGRDQAGIDKAKLAIQEAIDIPLAVRVALSPSQVRILSLSQLAQTTPAHILAASPTIRKDLVEKLRVCHVETSSYEEVTDATVAVTANQHAEPSSLLAAPVRD
jgi:hypothetical protein